MHASRVVPEQERLPGRMRPVDEVERMCEEIVLDSLHALSRQRARLFDHLLAYAPEAGIFGWIVHVRRFAGQHTARLEELHRGLVVRIVSLLWLVLGIQVVEVAVELVEPVHGRQKLVAISQVVFADLGGHVALWLEQLGQCRILRLDPLRRAGHAHRRQAGAHRDLPRDQCGTTGRAARLRVAVG